MAWLDRIFNRIGRVDKYPDSITLTIVALSEFLDYLAELCEEPPPAVLPDTAMLNQDLSELIAELSVAAEDGREAIG